MIRAGPSREEHLWMEPSRKIRLAKYCLEHFFHAIQRRSPSPETSERFWRTCSLNESEVAIFCHDFLKEKVHCLVGDANSGKTSLFFPILGLAHHRNVATVTKQRAFNKSMISPFTEVIFIDKATKSTMEISDWKILAQGGYTAHDVKYQNAQACINKCPMLITCQKKLGYGLYDYICMIIFFYNMV